MAIAPISPVLPVAFQQQHSLRADLTKAEKERLPKAVDQINQASELGNNNELQITTDQQTQRPVVQIVNRDTHEVIRQIPPRYVLQLAAEMSRHQGANSGVKAIANSTKRSL